MTREDALKDNRPKEVRLQQTRFEDLNGWVLRFEDGEEITIHRAWGETRGEVILYFEREGFTNIQRD